MKILLLFLITPITLCEVFSLNREFQVSNKVVADELAHAIYQKNDRKTGWNQLYIYTSEQAAPLRQHQAAGYLQGYATYREIWSAFINFVGLDFGGNRTAPEIVQKFLEDQIIFMERMVEMNPNNLFWTYIGYYINQVRYMHAGYMDRIRREKMSEYKLKFNQLYYLTFVGDLEDLMQLATQAVEERKNCNAYVRLSDQGLYLAHSTHNRYSFLLRIAKSWSFPRKDIPLQSVSFSSRPGDLISKDDFFILSSGLRVMETSLNNYVRANIFEVSSSTAPSWIRTLVANHLSSSPEEWISYFNTSRSGTHNNQWIIVDSKRIGKTEGVVMFFEEAFAENAVIDMTSQLIEKGYVAGYNMPMTPKVYHKLGLNETSKFSKHSDDPTYRTDLRAQIFAQIHRKMKTIDDMKFHLLANNEQPWEGLAPRYDVTPQGRPFGLTDCKIASVDTLQEGFYWAISGPSQSNGRFPPFNWKADSQYPHEGLVEVYDFEWQKISLNLSEKNKQLQEQ